MSGRAHFLRPALRDSFRSNAAPLHVSYVSEPDKQRRKELTPFDELGYTTVHSDWEEPRAYLVWRLGEDEATVLKLTNRSGKFELKLIDWQSGLRDELKAKLSTYTV